jgi:serine/threonine protein kinase/tetratricopeptide (TPR) repeat protein
MVNDTARVKSIFLAAVERYPAEQWTAYLDGACGEDNELRDRVQQLLAAHGDQKSLHIPSPSQAEVTVDRPIVERPGDAIGPYKLMEQIGEGGMGVVYVAEQHQPVRRKVALKIIKPGMDTKQVVARFEAERQALAMMDHPNIARVIDAGATESGRPFFVMELVRGIPITDYCDREKLSIPERLELFVLVCRAVQHAHQKGIIHRDLKPSNILVTVIDGAAVPKVIDFGVAKATGGSLTERTIYTAFQQFIGTPLYMSPEQADLSGMDMDTRSDVYSLGVLLYELLTGTTPFDPDTFRRAAFDELRRIIREEEPPKPSTRLSSLGATRTTVSANRQADARHLDRAVRGELDWIVMKCLEKDRNRRYETASGLAVDLRRYLDHEPVEAGPPSAWYRLRKYARRNRAVLATAAVVAAALVSGTAASTWQAIRATRAEGRAGQSAVQARTEAAIARAVNDFLREDLLAQASPEKQPDRDIKLRTVLDLAAEKITGRFDRQPLVEAAIRQTIGNAYKDLGMYREAQPHFERARDLRQSELGEQHPDTLAAMTGLAEVYVGLDQSDKAEPLLVRALEIGRRALGEEHPQTLEAMRDLGALYYSDFALKSKFGRRAEGESLVRQALEIGRRALGEEHPQVLRTMRSIAGLYLNRGSLAQAEPLLIKVLEVNRRLHGEEHPDTLAAMNGLAVIYAKQDKLAQAESLYIKALEGSRRVHGAEHEVTLAVMSNLAELYSRQGKLAEAESLQLKLLEAQRRLHGDEHPDTLFRMSRLGVLYTRSRKLAQAEPLLVKAVEGLRRTRGDEYSGTLDAISNLASLYRQQGKLAEAEPLYIKALEGYRRVLGEEFISTRDTIFDLATLYLDQGKATKAVPLSEQLVAIELRYRPNEPTAFNFMQHIVVMYINSRQFDRAIDMGQRALERSLRVLGEEHPITFSSMNNLAQAYQLCGQYDKALPLYTRALEVNRRMRGPEHVHSLWAMYCVAKCLLAQGKAAEAETLSVRHVEILRRKSDVEKSWVPLPHALNLLSRSLLLQGRYAEAEPVARESVTISRNMFPDDSGRFDSEIVLGASLLGLKKYAEAEPLLLTGYEGLKAARESTLPPAGKVLGLQDWERIVGLYESCGKPEKAAAWRAKVGLADLPAAVFARP